jgi:predicted permease
LQDIRSSIRQLHANPGFTLIVVLTLAIGIAANTTIFSWIDNVLVHPIPGIADPKDVFCFETIAKNGEHLTVSYPAYRDFRDNVTQLSGLVITRPAVFSVGLDDRPQRVWGELVSGNYFAVLGVKPELGRIFLPDEYGDKQGGFPVAVIGDTLWRRMFQADPGVIGRQIRINKQMLTVVGVAPPQFHGTVPGFALEIWVPAVMAAQLKAMPEWMLRERTSQMFLGLARLKPGVSMEQAQSEVTATAAEIARRNPVSDGGLSAMLVPVSKGQFGATALLSQPLRVLMAVCVVVLLIVCANVSNLLLARAMSRQREFAVRLAMGAGRMRIVRQLLIETLVLTAAGAAAAMALTLGLQELLVKLLPPTALPITALSGLNRDCAVFAIVVCLMTSTASGIAPALKSASTDPNSGLKEGGRSETAGARVLRLRGMLVVSEVALALVALVGAGLFAKSFMASLRIDPGFDARNVAVGYVPLTSSGYSMPERKLFCLRLCERLESLPVVKAVAYADHVPLGFDRGAWEDVSVDGYAPAKNENMKIYRDIVSPGYFAALHIPILEGRDFSERDDEKSLRVTIVTQAFARRFFAGRNPVGIKMRAWGDWFTVVGVVADTKYHTPNEAPMAHFYAPLRQVYREDHTLAFFVRAAGPAELGIAALRREAAALDPKLIAIDATAMEDYITAALYPERVAAILLSGLGALAMLLAAIGLYGVMSYSVNQRTHEVGIRIALGATSGNVVAMLVRQGLRFIGIGLAVGIAIALLFARAVSGVLLHVRAADPAVYLIASLFLAAVALVACYVPARRATHVEPNISLRAE